MKNHPHLQSRELSLDLLKQQTALSICRNAGEYCGGSLQPYKIPDARNRQQRQPKQACQVLQKQANLSKVQSQPKATTPVAPQSRHWAIKKTGCQQLQKQRSTPDGQPDSAW
ncbi:MAG TPA: hypothetical protein PLB25_18515 [Rhodoferax sp.]|nr:hypothetical protein [Rhodoferax sp.]